MGEKDTSPDQMNDVEQARQSTSGAGSGDVGQIGDQIGGDRITVGDIDHSYAAIGAGAQVIVNQVQAALSAVEELDKSIQAAERRLAEAIQKKIKAIARLRAVDVEARSNPYKALLDYKLEDAPFFYGRSEAIAAMREKLEQSRLTILHSDSGSGKSSLLQAGLAARLLAEGHFPLYLRPYDQRPDQTIKKAFLPDYATQEDLARFSDERMTLKGFLERVTHYLGERRLIILLDQFEEFFTELSAEQQQKFARQLLECMESDLPVWWVPALRKEYFSDLRIFSSLRPYDNEYFLPTFRLDEAQEVIIEPAALKDASYEEGLVDRIVDDIRHGSAEIQPAQVQLVCYTLFDELPGDGAGERITLDLYNKLRGRARGAEGILTSHLSRVLDRELKGKERAVAGLVLEELVTSDVRRVMRGQEELLQALDAEQAALLAPVLRALHENRLVRLELDANDEPVYELAHDYLLKEIELDPETRARKAAQELLNQEAHAYMQFGTLLSEDKFAIINNRRDSLQIDTSAAELLEKSERAIEAERRREAEQQRALAEEQRKRAEEAEAAAEMQRRSSARLRWLVLGLVLILAAALVLAWFANRQNQSIGAQRLTAESRLQARDGLVHRATLLALEGRQQDPEGAARMLGDELLDRWEPPVGTLEEQWTMYESVAWSPDGRLLASGSSDNSIKLWDTEAGELLKTLGEHGGVVRSVAWSPDGRMVASGSDDDTIKLWDVEGEALIKTLTEHKEDVNSVAWSPDGQLASGSDDGTIKLWDVERGESVETLEDLNSFDYYVNSVAWNPAVRMLASGSSDGKVRLWDLARGEVRETFEEHEVWVTSVAWSPDGDVLASGSADGTIKLWHVRSGEPAQRLEGHGDWVNSVAWSPYGDMLASASDDETIMLWDVTGEEPVQTFTKHSESVQSIAWSPYGDLMASGSGDGSILLWPSWTMQDPCEWVEGNLTPEEWLQYVGYSVYEPTCPAKPSAPSPAFADAFVDFPDNLGYLLITRPGRTAVGIAGLLVLILAGLLLWGNYRLLQTRSGRIAAVAGAAITVLLMAQMIYEGVTVDEWPVYLVAAGIGLASTLVLWIGYRFARWLIGRDSRGSESPPPA